MSLNLGLMGAQGFCLAVLEKAAVVAMANVISKIALAVATAVGWGLRMAIHRLRDRLTQPGSADRRPLLPLRRASI